MAIEDSKTRAHIDRGVDALVAEFGGAYSRPTAELPAPRFNDFVPLLVHRYARERLARSLAIPAPATAASAGVDLDIEW